MTFTEDVHDNMQEYLDAELYDTENEAYQEDVKCLLEIAKKQGGPIIDLACGTGRASIPLAEAGYEVIGIDLSESMLAQARIKGEGKSVQWLLQDCTKFEAGTKSPFIYSVGNSFQHLLTNREQVDFLRSVYQHLLPNGLFMFNLRFPSREELLQPEQEEFSHSYHDAQQRIIDVYYSSSYNPLKQVQTYITRRVFFTGTLEEEKVTQIQLRYTYPQELLRLLEEIGFQVEGLYKNWSLEPLTGDAYNMIVLCKKQG